MNSSINESLQMTCRDTELKTAQKRKENIKTYKRLIFELILEELKNGTTEQISSLFKLDNGKRRPLSLPIEYILRRKRFRILNEAG